MPRFLLPMLLLFAAVTTHAAPHRVFIAGDSTAADYGPERAPLMGWGQALPSYLDPAVWQVRNHAKAGRSARSSPSSGTPPVGGSRSPRPSRSVRRGRRCPPPSRS